MLIDTTWKQHTETQNNSYLLLYTNTSKHDVMIALFLEIQILLDFTKLVYLVVYHLNIIQHVCCVKHGSKELDLCLIQLLLQINHENIL